MPNLDRERLSAMFTPVFTREHEQLFLLLTDAVITGHPQQRLDQRLHTHNINASLAGAAYRLLQPCLPLIECTRLQLPAPASCSALSLLFLQPHELVLFRPRQTLALVVRIE
ncbi:hypothetical protein [Craterilacuibacter sinensis]|uniref:Uncharacterized protein n=1 Tax=Craterilacuibacter sinensis TaxID=2686017 RepID=A0A845BHR1_9NEIS|nr:hypothetical protein [Craterilacuibacter sinensis]MXR35845.1 hypothetical protein [Craterilacuibacter sinensis]